MTLTVLTWNLKGSERPDTDAVVGHARTAGADVLFLQEVQRRQARAIARGLGAVSLVWAFKHWPVVRCAEGMAVVSVSRRADLRCRPLTGRWLLWSWRRRIAQSGLLAAEPPGPGGATPPSDPLAGPVRLVNLHLSPRGAPGLREREVTAVLDIVTIPDAASSSGDDRSDGRGTGGALPLVLAGDLNDSPGAALFDHLDAAGLRDAWEVAHPGRPEHEGATNWSGGREGDPRRRIDYVLASPDIGVESASVPRPGDERFEGFRALSDHLPLTVVLGS